jgi:hypothetical protein
VILSRKRKSVGGEEEVGWWRWRWWWKVRKREREERKESVATK